MQVYFIHMKVYLPKFKIKISNDNIIIINFSKVNSYS